MNYTNKTKVNFTEMITLSFMSEYPHDLEYIATRLESLEETIIYKLLDRAQFAANKNAYCSGQSGFIGNKQDSLFEIRLATHETMDAEFGRFQVPEERPFTKILPKPKREVTIDTSFLSIKDFNIVNLCDEIKTAYLALLPRLCRNTDDAQYGSSVENDVFAVQSISRRIHYGSFYIAECKFRDSPEEYTSLIRKREPDKLLEKLTRKDIEDRITSRIHGKICSVQKNIITGVRNVVDPEIITTFYRDTIIPLTKKGEVIYLMNRQL